MVVPVNPATFLAASAEGEPFDPEPFGELATEFIECKGELTPRWLASAATLLAATLGGPWAGAITGTFATALAVALGKTGTARLAAAEKECAERETLRQDVKRAVAEAFKAEASRLALTAREEREAAKNGLARAVIEGLAWLQERGQLHADELRNLITMRGDALSEQSASEFLETIKYIFNQHVETRRVVLEEVKGGFANQDQQHERTRQSLSEGLQRLERLVSLLGEVRPGAERKVLDRQTTNGDPRFVGRRLQVTLFLGCQGQQPLPRGLEIAKSVANVLIRTELACNLVVDIATRSTLLREARRGADLFVFVGQATANGLLEFLEESFGFSDLNVTSEEQEFWTRLGASIICATNGHIFAEALPCPWIALDNEASTNGPKAFLEQLVRQLDQVELSVAVQRAKLECGNEVTQQGTGLIRFSETPFPRLVAPKGSAKLVHVSPAIAGSYVLDFEDLAQGNRRAEGYRPFVGRKEALESLKTAVPHHGDSGLAPVVMWIHGESGVGKSALLRRFSELVRDTEFRASAEQVYLLHCNCFEHTQAVQVERTLCARAQRLYRLPVTPSSMGELFQHLDTIEGTHVWVLDDLTGMTQVSRVQDEAARVVELLNELARTHAVSLLILASSRKAPKGPFRDLVVPPLTAPEAIRLAQRIYEAGGAQLPDILEDVVELHAAVAHSTAAFRRALMYASDVGQTPRQYLASLRQRGSDAHEQHVSAEKGMFAHEIEQLGKQERSSGFKYREFVALLYPLVRQASYFSVQELVSWFSSRFCTDEQRPVDVAYQNGVDYLSRMGFLTQASRGYTIASNQRWSLFCLSSNATLQLPTSVPLRGAGARLASALDQLEKGNAVALGELLHLEHEYAAQLSLAPDVAAAVFYSRLVRAELAGKTQAACDILTSVVEAYDSLPGAQQDAEEVVIPLAKALTNRGLTRGELGQFAEERRDYERVKEAYGHRSEPAIVELVAKSIFNTVVWLRKNGRRDEELSLCDQLVALYGGKIELAQYVAIALFTKGKTSGEVGRPQDELDAYNTLIDLYRDLDEPIVQESIARALLGKGRCLGLLGRREESFASYDELVSRFGGSEKAGLAEHVASAMFNKARAVENQGDTNAALAEYDKLERFECSRLVGCAEQAARALTNKSVLYAKQRSFSEAIRCAQRTLDLFEKSSEPILRQQVAKAHLHKALYLLDNGQINEALTAFDASVKSPATYADAETGEHVAKALLGKANAVARDAYYRAAAVLYGLANECGTRLEASASARICSTARVHQADLLLRGGSTAEAEEVLDEVIRVWFGCTDPEVEKQLALAIRDKITASRHTGNVERLAREYERLLDRFETTRSEGAVEVVAQAIAERGIELQRERRLPEAFHEYDRLRDWYGEVRSQTVIALLVRCLINKGAMLYAIDQRAAAGVVLEDAALRCAGQPHERIRALGIEAELYKAIALGQTSRARALLDRADRLNAMELGMNIEPARQWVSSLEMGG